MTIGELLKQYRLKAGKNQKTWIGPVVSPSFYSKVEKNASRISAADLVEILRYNNVAIADFFEQIDYQAKPAKEVAKELNQQIYQAYYRSDRDALKQIRQIVASSSLSEKDDLLLDLDAYIYLVGLPNSTLRPETKQQLKKRFFNSEQLNRKSLVIFCNFMYFYDFASNLIITKRIIKQFARANDSEIQAIVLAIVINMLIMCIEHKSYADTKPLLQLARQIPAAPENCFPKMTMVILENLVNYHYDRQREYLDRCTTMIEQFSLIGMNEGANGWRNFVEQNKG